MLNTDDLRHYTGIGTGYSPEMMMQLAADEIDGLRGKAEKALEILNTARCTTNRSALFDLIVQATGPLMPNSDVTGLAPGKEEK